MARPLAAGGKLHIREPLGRHGMSVEAIRELMADHALEEISHEVSKRRLVGTMYEGVFQKVSLS